MINQHLKLSAEKRFCKLQKITSLKSYETLKESKIRFDRTLQATLGTRRGHQSKPFNHTYYTKFEITKCNQNRLAVEPKQCKVNQDLLTLLYTIQNIELLRQLSLFKTKPGIQSVISSEEAF